MTNKRFKILGAIGVLLICLILFLSSSIFTIEDINISGNKILTSTEIEDVANLKNNNIFMFKESKIKKKFLENTLVSDISIKRIIPNKIDIKIKERVPSGYVKYLEDSYLYIDEEGLVLEVLPSFKDDLPLITGLEFDNFKIGDTLKVKEDKSIESVVNLVYLFNKYDLMKEIVKLDVSNPEELHLYSGNIDIVFGNITDSEFKVKKIKASLGKMADYKDIKSVLDIDTGIIKLIT